MLSKTNGSDNELSGAARICDLYTVSIGLTGGDVKRRDWRFHRIQRNIQGHKGGYELLWNPPIHSKSTEKLLGIHPS